MRKSVLQHNSVQKQTINALSHRIKPTAIALAVATCFSANVAYANPTAPTVVSGTASFNQAGNILNITNSHNAIINWGSFSIGLNELTKFIQPSALSAVLNRVTGQDPSAILGALQSNGKVFLLNPNGIVFGAGSQINVAGLVASTLNLSDSDFLAGRMRFTDGAGAGSVVNNGQITGGSVYLVGNAVTNNGLITSPGGEVVLAAGNSVELVNPGTPNLRVEIVAPDNEARNLGTITAEAGRIGIYAGLINNSGTLNASSAVSEGGKILLKAKKDITLTSSSVIDASGKGGGEIIALADNNTYVDGTLKASAPVSGNGGFIETSGKNRVKIADSAIIDTTASQGIKGTWLIDPSDFVIAAGYGGDISGSNLSSLLQSTDIVISTAAYGGPNYYYGSGAYGGGNGDILVNDSVSWDSSNSLTLTAQRHVVVNQAITNLGDGDIRLNAGWDGSTDPAFPTLANSVAGISLNAPISTGGSAYLHAGGDIIQGISAPIVAVNLDAVSDYGVVSLNNSGSANMVGTLTGSARGSFAFKNSGALTVGSSGISVSADGGNPGQDASLSLSTTAGSLAINGSINVYGGPGDGAEGSAGGNASVVLASAGDMQINSAITAQGAYGGYGYSSGGNGGNGTVTMTSSGNLVVNGYVSANGGAGGDGYSGANGGRGGDGKVMMTAAGNLSVLGSISGIGGDGGYTDTYYGGPLGIGGSGGDGIVQLTAGNISGITGSVVAEGGWGGNHSSYGGTDGNGGHALVVMNSSNGISLSNAYISADGGEGQISGTGGAAGVTMIAGGNIQIEGGEGGSGIYAAAGSGASGGNASVAIIAGGNIGITGAEVMSGGGNGNTPGLGSVVLASAGNLNITDAYITSNGGVGLGGANIMLDYASVFGYGGIQVDAAGNLDLINGSGLFGVYGSTYVKTGGNVTVDNSGIVGNPDVFMTVGGVVNINNGGGIVAGAPTTIHLTFPMLTSGGYFVNGIEGVVFDPLTGTGFFADGSPAILGTNLLVTYGGGVTLNIPTDALIVAMGESSKPPDPEKDKDVFEDLKKDKEKEAPVCR